jgi:exonuclease VII large subunit
VVYLAISKAQLANDKKNKDAYSQAIQMINDARMASMHIIKDAHLKALRTLENSSVFNKDLKREVETSIDHLTNKHLTSLDSLSRELEESYKKAVTEQKDKDITTIESASESMKSEILREVEEFKQTLQKETFESQEMVEQKVSEEYEKVKSQIEDYKNVEIKKIDENMFSIVLIASKKIFGRTLDLDTHEQIVIDSLEEAKKEGVFSK